MVDGCRGRYVSIQLLRILACLGVFCVHFGQRVDLTGRIRIITDFGRYGVHVFFIISGFLAAKGLVGREIKTGAYYYKRAVHILPLYFLSILYFFVTENFLEPYLHQIPPDAAGLGWLRYLFFLNGFIKSDTYFWSNLGITWTIPIFVVFYLTAPMILRHIHSFSSGCMIAGTVILLTRELSEIYSCTVFGSLYVFYFGVIAYCAIKYGYAIPTALFFQLLAIVMIVFNKTEYMYVSLFSGIAILLVMMEDQLNLPSRVAKWIDYIDQRTYTLYLVHGMVFCSFIDRLYLLDSPFWVRGILAVTLSTIGTILVYRFYEKPVQSWLTKIGKEQAKTLL